MVRQKSAKLLRPSSNLGGASRKKRTQCAFSFFIQIFDMECNHTKCVCNAAVKQFHFVPHYPCPIVISYQVWYNHFNKQEVDGGFMTEYINKLDKINSKKDFLNFMELYLPTVTDVTVKEYLARLVGLLIPHIPFLVHNIYFTHCTVL